MKFRADAAHGAWRFADKTESCRNHSEAGSVASFVQETENREVQ